jgi:hypothetical protein
MVASGEDADTDIEKPMIVILIARLLCIYKRSEYKLLNFT